MFPISPSEVFFWQVLLFVFLAWPIFFSAIYTLSNRKVLTRRWLFFFLGTGTCHGIWYLSDLIFIALSKVTGMGLHEPGAVIAYVAVLIASCLYGLFLLSKVFRQG
jgi:hypothetical protein